MKFCMVVDMDNIYILRLTMKMKMMTIMVMMIKIAITHPIFKLGGPDFAW